MASKSLARAQRHFKHVKALREAKAPARQITKLSDTWMRRGSASVTGLYRKQAAKPGLATIHKGDHHHG